MFKKIFIFISREFRLLFVHPYIFFLRWFGCFFLNSILGIKKDLYYNASKHIRIKFPNKIGVSYVLMETFIYKVFSKMHGLDRVLDIGGFIGESALYLSEYNKEVECYELSQANFNYLQENCKNKTNIVYHNAGVTASYDDYIEYDDASGVDSTVKTKSSVSKYIIKIKNVNILTLLKNKHFDGLKLDIEGGEYEILQSVIDHELFDFKKGIIEFHDLHMPEKLSFLKNFIEYLLGKGYIYSLLTNENRKLNLSDLHNVKYCNIYFELH